MARNEDRERLAEVRQQDLKEGRVNEDFVTWLKTKGPTWLLIVLAFIVAYLVMIRWQQQEARSRDEAWVDLMTTVQPASLEDVARRHAEIDGVADIARLTAADSLLQEIQRGSSIGEDGQTSVELTPETRTQHLATADRIYQEVASDDDGSPARTLATVCALNGLAAIAECRGDVDAAVNWYRKSEARAGDWYPALAAQANARAASAPQFAEVIELATPPTPPTPKPPPPAVQGTPLGATPAEAPPSEQPAAPPAQPPTTPAPEGGDEPTPQ
ncbi:MAG: hypothetical protein QF561_06065 [Phycisphaerales bacterium]|nr:hypothetical protein [Phycisphaerales bacterium]